MENLSKEEVYQLLIEFKLSEEGIDSFLSK